MNIKKLLSLLTVVLSFALIAQPAYADALNVNFENPPYTLGSINSVDGWSALGSVGSGCALYDQFVSSSLGTPGFGSQSLRISDAVTSGCFSDQVFAKPLTDAVGEKDSTASTFPTGNLQRHFEMQFDIASTVPDAQQPGLHVSVSPDRGDGSRMSYLRFEDGTNGLDVYFDDVVGTTNPANFHETLIASGLDRKSKHSIKLTLDTLDGPSNDVVKVWIDGTLKITGTSWENYYRYDTEASAEQSPRIVKTVLFRSAGAAISADQGKGFLFDNLYLKSGHSSSDDAKDQCKNEKTFTATRSLYYNGPTSAFPLYGSGPISFTWNKQTGVVTSGFYTETAPAYTGTVYYNLVTSGSVIGNVVHLSFTRTNPNAYSFTFNGTLTGKVLSGQLDGPYLFTATGRLNSDEHGDCEKADHADDHGHGQEESDHH